MKQLYITPCSFWVESLAATHPDDLTLFERVALKNHMASCPTCTAIRAEYEAMGSRISQLRTVEPRPELPPALLKLWQKQKGKRAAVSSLTEEEQVEIADDAPVPQSMPSLPPRRRPRRGVLIQAIAAVLIVSVLLGGFLVVFASHRAKTGESSPAPAWKIVDSQDPGATENILHAVTAVSANDVWAVGETSSSGYIDQPIHMLISSDALIEHWNGKQWNVIPGPNPALIKPSLHALNALFGVAAISMNDVWAVGETYQYGQLGMVLSQNGLDDQVQGLIEHWNGRQWSIVPLPKVAKSYSFSAVAAISSNDVWAVGDVIAHWDGAKWSIVPGPSLGTNQSSAFSALATVSARDVWVVGGSFGSTSGQSLIAHWDGTSWSIVKSPDAQSILSSMAVISSNNIWAVGDTTGNGHGYGQVAQPRIEHWNGAQWKIVNSPGVPFYNSILSAVVAISPNDVWAVGEAPHGYP
ncbi:MAG: hypothetical protein ACRDIV_17975, partial [Ktedonobacteraceae bacterium]